MSKGQTCSARCCAAEGAAAAAAAAVEAAAAAPLAARYPGPRRESHQRLVALGHRGEAAPAPPGAGERVLGGAQVKCSCELAVACTVSGQTASAQSLPGLSVGCTRNFVWGVLPAPSRLLRPHVTPATRERHHRLALANLHLSCAPVLPTARPLAAAAYRPAPGLPEPSPIASLPAIRCHASPQAAEPCCGKRPHKRALGLLGSGNRGAR